MPSSETREIDLTLKCDGASSSEGATCHLMPCSIEHNQTRVKAKEYFWPTVRELKIGGDDEQGRGLKHDKSIGPDNDQDPVLLASFRGRPLQGRRVELPAGYVGHVVSKPKSQSVGGNQKIKKHFHEFTYWNWDQLPDKNDSVVKAFNWLQVAKTIHDPVE